MHSLLLSLIPAFLSLTCFASPRPPSQLYPRQVKSLPTPPVAGITTTISTRNGTDVSSNFQSLLFQGPIVNVPSNLTDRQVSGLMRPINFCKSIQAEILYSECDYRTGHGHSMQRYKVHCYIPSRDFAPRPRYFTEKVRKVSIPSRSLSLSQTGLIFLKATI